MNVFCGFLVLSLSVLQAFSAAPHPTFVEGEVNSTINFGLVLNEVRMFSCTVQNDTDNEFKELQVIPPPSEGNWEFKQSEEGKRVEITILGATTANEGLIFTCTAIDTGETISKLNYNITAVDEGTTFKEGAVNSTVNTNLVEGVKSQQINCTVDKADPAVTKLTMEPLPGPGNNDYRPIGEGTSWVGFEFEKINDNTPTGFTCIAESSATVAKLFYSASIVSNGIKFSEGDVNSTVNRTLITETKDSIRCTVENAYPPLTDLSILPEPHLGDEDYRIVRNGTNWIEVEFLKINDNTPVGFECIAKNNDTIAKLNYNLAIKDPVPPIFTMGSNITIWNEMRTGENHTLACTVVADVALPEINALTANPPSSENWKVIEQDKFSVEIQFTKADSSKNRRDYICTASNGLRTTSLTYLNFVGGPPTALDVKIDSVLSKNTIELTMMVTDRSLAPARNIMVHVEGATDGNKTLKVPIPENFDDEIRYGFTNFLKLSTKDFSDTSPQLRIYANNTLGEAFVKEVAVTIPKKKSSSSTAGDIAAGILVPFFLILGGVIIAFVVYYFWKKNKRGSIGFSRVGDNEIEDASKSTYGAL